MAASCLFFHDLMKPPLASEIQVKFSVAILSLHTSCAKQQGAQGSLHLFLFNDILRFPSTETSKHSERSLKTLALFFLRSRVAKSPTWQGSAPSPWSLFLWPSQSSRTIIGASSYLALQSTLPAMDKSFDLCMQSPR